MKTTRAISIGALIWLIIFSLFGLLNFIPAVSQSQTWQGLIIGICIIPAASWGAVIYYKKAQGHGLAVGTVMLTTAMALDALITVPLMEMPLHGIDHAAFFTNPLLWILVAENIIVIYAYWVLKMKSGKVIRIRSVNFYL